MSRVLYPLNYVPNGTIQSYSPCFIKRTSQPIGTKTSRPLGLKLEDAMRLAWIVRSFKVSYITYSSVFNVYMYANNDPGLFDGPFDPPDDERLLVCCGFNSPLNNPSRWGNTFKEESSIDGNPSKFFQISIQETKNWIASGYPSLQNPNPNFNPITDLTIYPQITMSFSGTSGITYAGATFPSPSATSFASSVFLPKSAGFSQDYSLDFYSNPGITASAPIFTFDNFWEYRDESGQNPIWDKTTGARL